MASTTAEEPALRDTNAMARQKMGDDDAPAVLRIMKTQLNFFMTRLLFMQEEHADSLGARATKAVRMQNSNSSFGGSASKLGGGDHPAATAAAAASQQKQHDGLLGYFDEADEDDDDICIFSDNARILPNKVAKSMPPIPFPPAAPESPRPIEGKGGVVVKTPTHQQAALNCLGMPEALPLAEMELEDTDRECDDENMTEEGGEPGGADSSEAEEEVAMEEVEEVVVEGTDKLPLQEPRSCVAAIPTDQRVFPKNQRRSKRASAVLAKRDEYGRSLSASKMTGGGTSSDDDSTDHSVRKTRGMSSSSCH